MDSKQAIDLYHRLLDAYGPQGWWPGNDDPLSIIAGAILVQRAAWTNAKRALDALREARLLTIAALTHTPQETIAHAVRPAVFYNAKAAKLKAFARHVTETHEGDLGRWLSAPTDPLRTELLSIHGIGPETADVILLYAAGRRSFVVDAYTRRLLARLGWPEGAFGYERMRKAFMAALPADVSLFNEFHALIVEHGKAFCRATPRCTACSLRPDCRYGAEGEAGSSGDDCVRRRG